MLALDTLESVPSTAHNAGLMPTLAAAIDIDPMIIRDGVTYMVALILSITVHEYGHARVADHLGDRLPRMQGRVTLNPVSHIDLIGTILFPLIAFVSAVSGSGLGARLLGWGKPVQISLLGRSFRYGLSRRGAHFLIAAAGPMMNLLFGLVLSIAFIVLGRSGAYEAAGVVGAFVIMNVGLAFFNLIPCPPLDGGALLLSVLPEQHPVATFLERYGFVIFFALLLTGFLTYLMWPAQLVGSAWLRQLASWAQ